mmetsp:Transcript_61867/g.130612  ORF Transcript_61867/g.130612 Transcript_61867/m.130612 type:complete len:228 (+) Transcript_61867:251-934(+)
MMHPHEESLLEVAQRPVELNTTTKEDYQRAPSQKRPSRLELVGLCEAVESRSDGAGVRGGKHVPLFHTTIVPPCFDGRQEVKLNKGMGTKGTAHIQACTRGAQILQAAGRLQYQMSVAPPVKSFQDWCCKFSDNLRYSDRPTPRGALFKVLCSKEELLALQGLRDLRQLGRQRPEIVLEILPHCLKSRCCEAVEAGSLADTKSELAKMVLSMAGEEPRSLVPTSLGP